MERERCPGCNKKVNTQMQINTAPGKTGLSESETQSRSSDYTRSHNLEPLDTPIEASSSGDCDIG